MLKFIYSSNLFTVAMSLLIVLPTIFITSCAVNNILLPDLSEDDTNLTKYEILLADGTTTFLNRKEIYAGKIHNMRIFQSYSDGYYFNYLDKNFYITEATSLNKEATLERAIKYSWYVIWMDSAGKIHIAYDFKSGEGKDILIVKTNPDIYSVFKATDDSVKYNSLR